MADRKDENLSADATRRTTLDDVTSKNLTDESMSTRTRDEEVRVPVVEEELAVGKRTVETSGGVRVNTTVSTKAVEEDVRLHEEHVTVERRPVDRELGPEDMRAFENTTVEMHEMAEEAVVQKRARVVEEVVVGKEARERTEHISDTIRRTDVDIQPIAAGTTAARAGGFESIDASCRTHFNSNFKDSGWDYDTGYQHAYRYGYDLSSSGKDWNTMEPEVRNNWETRNQGTWDRFKDAIRHGFDQSR